MLILGVFFAGLLVYGLFSRVLDTRSLTPQVAMLAMGLGLGSFAAGTGEIEVDAELLHVAGEIALILCLFIDAARIDVGALRGSAGLPTRLLAIGLPLTLVAGTAAALLVFPGIVPIDALLLALLVAPTDAALGILVVSSPKVPIRIRQALNVESGLNDGLVTPLVLVAVIAGQAEAGASNAGWVADAVAQLGFGTIAGLAVGVGGAMALKVALRRHWVLEGARWMTAPALAFLAWFVADLVGGNAFVAAFVAGLASTATYGRVPDDFLEFGEVTGELVGLAVFFLFGVLVPALGPFDLPVVLFAILALTIVRIGPVAVSLIRTGLSPSTVAFMGWFGPRGLASIVLTLVAVGNGADAPPVFDPVVVSAVVLTVVFSVFAHGLSAGPAVRWYERSVRELPDTAPELATVADLAVRRRALAAKIAITGSSGTGDGARGDRPT